MPRPEVVPAGGLPLLIEEEGHVVSEAYRIRGDLMTGSKKGDPEADYLKAIELARLQGRACVPRQRERADERDLLGPIYGWFTKVH